MVHDVKGGVLGITSNIVTLLRQGWKHFFAPSSSEHGGNRIRATAVNKVAMKIVITRTIRQETAWRRIECHKVLRTSRDKILF
jgi:hypothetical protein